MTSLAPSVELEGLTHPVEVELHLGYVPIGNEDLYRVEPDELTMASIDHIREHVAVDVPRHTKWANFTRHSNDHFETVSAITKESHGIWRASSFIITTGLEYYGETHLFNPHDAHSIEPEHIHQLQERHKLPFRNYGRFLMTH